MTDVMVNPILPALIARWEQLERDRLRLLAQMTAEIELPTSDPPRPLRVTNRITPDIAAEYADAYQRRITRWTNHRNYVAAARRERNQRKAMT